MPRFRRQGFGRGSVAPKRQIGNSGFTAEIDGGTSVIGIVKLAYNFGFVAAVDALTVVRTRGEFGVRIAAAAAGDTILRGALGMIVVSSDAFAVGVTAVPGPISDVGNDWFVWAPFNLLYDDVVTEFDSKYVATVPFDSRGMRKMKIGQNIVVVLEVEADRAGSSIDSSVSLRLQFKL